jgi:hypothetical protein
MLIVSRRAQGFAGEVSGLLGEVIERLLQVVELLPLGSIVPSLEVPVVSVGRFQSVNQQGILAPSQVFRSESTASPDGSIEIGSAIAIDECHLYYAPLRAPIPARNRFISLSSSRSA